MRRSDVTVAEQERIAEDGTIGLPPKRFGRGLAAAVVAVIVVVGLAASGWLYAQAERDAEDEEAALAARASRALQTSSDAFIASVASASAVVDADGAVEESRFDTFAKGTVSTTLLPVLAYVEVVDDADRAEFEATIGKPIAEARDGALVPAARRDTYLVVKYVFPESTTSVSVIGFDIGSESTRAAAARAAVQTGTAIFSAPVTSQPSGQLSFFAVQPLFRPGMATDTAAHRREALAGYVSSLAPSRTILGAIVDQLPPGSRVAVTDSGKLLATTDRPPRDGHTLDVQQAGRLWTIEVEHHDADLSSTYLLLVSTLLLAVSVSIFLWRIVKQAEELREVASGVRQLGLLSERLAMADTVEQAIAVIVAGAGSTVGSKNVVVAIPGPEAGTLVGHRTDGEPQALVTTQPSPSSDAWNTRNAVFISDEAGFRGLYADGVQERADRGVTSMAALPLRRTSGEMLGVIAWEWPTANRFGASTRSMLQATAEACQQSLARAEEREQQWASASAMAALSQRLAVTRNVRQIASAIVDLGPAASGASFVGVGLIDDAAGRFDVYNRSTDDPVELPVDVKSRSGLMSMLRKGQPIEFQSRDQLERFPALVQMLGVEMRRLTCIPLVDSEAQLRGVIAFVYASDAPAVHDPGPGRLAAIAELTAQTVERAMLYLHEHELVLNLQRQTLPELPSVPGLQMAARYLPSATTLGLGGDWYDVHELGSGRVGMVVGDVSGHGIDAIADMTEFRTTVSTLLRTGRELGEIPQLSTALLRHADLADVRFATAGLMVLDTTTLELSWVRAGHPPMLVREPGGRVELLERGGGSPVGITDLSIATQTMRLERGSVVVAYTDGLIERRNESIDAGLDRLRAALATCSPEVLWRGADAIADALVDRCLGQRHTADDAALLVVVVE